MNNDDDNIDEIYKKLQSSFTICEEDIRKIIKDSLKEMESKKPKNIIAPWDRDESIMNCYVCMTKFSFFIRKHHCRACGNIICDKCSQYKKPVPIYGYYKPVRICKRCMFGGYLNRD